MLLRQWRHGGASVLAVLAVAACSPSAQDDPIGLRAGAIDDVVFLAQSVRPDAVMNALFQGRVLRDAAGCLRLDTEEAPSVVWPFGSTLLAQGGELRVRDARGRVVGTIGETFRLGGGEVPFLHDGIALTAPDRERAARCAGRYWIVGDVL